MSWKTGGDQPFGPRGMLYCLRFLLWSSVLWAMEMIGPVQNLLFGGWLLMTASSLGAAERQVTHDTVYDHWLDNNDNFSPDDRFLVFDTRTATGIADSALIAKVEIATGIVTPLYRPDRPNSYGPGVAAASYAPHRDEVAFIHGPLRPTGPENQYEKYRRIGAMVSGDGRGAVKFADARNTRPPYTLGALRGGTHRHEFSGDGKWIGFTYNDAVVRAYGLRIGKDLDLRTIGVTELGDPISVSSTSQFPAKGEGFSVLVVHVTPDPKPGSDEISRAAFDSWVGLNGYRRADGGRQLARAFIGTTRDTDGRSVDELFLVDIPENIMARGPLGPLQGTDTAFPMPPAGAAQRRLTHTEHEPYPGCEGIARSAPDGERISFRRRDQNGRWQIFVIGTNASGQRQATFAETGVDTDARWHPSGRAIACVAGNKILIVDVTPERFGQTTVLSERAPAPFALVWSHDGKTLAYNRVVKTNENAVMQIFVADVALPVH
jgi:hypothetical protein